MTASRAPFLAYNVSSLTRDTPEGHMGKFKVGDNVHAKFDSDAFGPQEFDGVVVEQTELDAIAEKFLGIPLGVAVRRPDGEVFEIADEEATFLSSEIRPVDENIPDLALRELEERVRSRFNSLVRNFNANGEQFAKSVNDLVPRIEALEANQRERDEYRTHKEEEGEDYESRIEDLEIICGQTICASHVDHGRLLTIEAKLDIEHVEPDGDDAEENGYNMYHRIRDALRENLDAEPLSEEDYAILNGVRARRTGLIF
jgi:hypothetical protein